MDGKYLWWGLAGIMGILGIMFLGVVGITPEMVDEGLESIRVVDPMAVDQAIHEQFSQVEKTTTTVSP